MPVGVENRQVASCKYHSGFVKAGDLVLPNGERLLRLMLATKDRPRPKHHSFRKDHTAWTTGGWIDFVFGSVHRSFVTSVHFPSALEEKNLRSIIGNTDFSRNAFTSPCGFSNGVCLEENRTRSEKRYYYYEFADQEENREVKFGLRPSEMLPS
ncbi:hypothetical protein Tco_0455820, partial [Tanacetum coccineum]